MDAESAVVQYEDRIKKLLEKFLEPNFEIKNDTYLNMLLSHLSGKDNKDFGRGLINLPAFTDWLFLATRHWEESELSPPPNITAFTVHLAGLLSRNESRFISFNACNVYVRLNEALKVRAVTCSPSIKLAYVKLLTSFLEHKSGTDWLMTTDNWQDVLSFCMDCQTVYLLREGQSFIYNLLEKTARLNLTFASGIVEKIMLVFNGLHFPNGSIIPEVNDEIVEKKLTPTLRLVSSVLESHLQSDLFMKRDYTVPNMFLKTYHLEQNVWNIIMMGGQNRELLFDLNKVMVLNYFIGLAVDTEAEHFQCKDLKRLFDNILKLIKIHIARNDNVNILRLCYFLLYYWKLLSPRVQLNMETEDDNLPLFENQVLFFQVLPIVTVSYATCRVDIDTEDMFRDQFITKILKIVCEHTLRLLYSFRAVLAADKCIFDNGLKAIMFVMKSRKLYHRDRGVIIFQSLIYILVDVVGAMKDKPEMIEVFTKQVRYFSAHLDALATFIEEFEITWRESVETICVMSVSMEFMSFPHWPPHLVVQALKLVNLSIAKFMTPNQALLVDKTSDSTLAFLGPMITAKLHDVNWEVRDTALEVLHTISNIAHTKFPSFQHVVLECELLSLMVTMCACDGESFVRASAVKCLQEMIKVPAFWEGVLKRQDLPEKMIDILYNETEAIVRCEAATLMYKMYEHQRFSQEMEEKVSVVMAHAATSDLHWEVKLKALCYWNKVIDQELSNQGMIDGSFPTVTFSKERRKIINLTEVEVRNRLQKVLLDLSKCGCLAVLIACMKDECDLEVAKKAVNITKKLVALLNSYSVSGGDNSGSNGGGGSSTCTPTPTSPKAVMDTFNLTNSRRASSNSPARTSSADDVINEICNCRDISLLKNVYVKDETGSPGDEKSREIPWVSPKEFLEFIEQDLDGLVTNKRKWLDEIDDLGSLLDDILKTYDDEEDNDINAMDCY